MSEPRTGNATAAAAAGTRDSLMERHREARARREAASLGSDEFRRAAEDIARIEIAIAQLEEPPPRTP